MDLDFIKQKLDVLQGKNKQNSRFWKPQDGEQKVRIVPYKYNDKTPFVELKFYYFRQPNGTTKTFLSPEVNGNRDPILEFCEKLRLTGTKENWILSKSYEPKLRTYVPVIVRGQEDKGVKFWGFGKQVYESILEKMSNPDIGDITDLVNGNDLIIKFTKNPPGGKKYPETKIDVRIKKTPAVDPADDNLLGKLQDQVDIMTLFTEPSYDELKKEFENHINPDNEPESGPEVEDAEGASPTTSLAEESATTEESSVEPVESPAVPVEPVVSPTSQNATVNLTPEQIKEKFKKMFSAAASDAT